MKDLIWNCRGIRKTGVSSFFRDLIHEHHFHFICIQETMIPDCDDKLFDKFDPHKQYLQKWLPSRGKSGGILCGINNDFLEAGPFHKGQFMLQLNLWDKALRRKWNLINLYGAAQDENKDRFLAELASFCGHNSEPILIGGDFNIIRFSSEKKQKYWGSHSLRKF